MVELPYEYNVGKGVDMEAYKAERQLKDLFTKTYNQRAEKGIQLSPLVRGTKAYKTYRENLEEFYGEVLEEIERSPKRQLMGILKGAFPVTRMFHVLNIPSIDYRTGKRELVNN